MSGYDTENNTQTDPRRVDLERGILRVGEHFASLAATENTSELEQLKQQLLLAQAENQRLKSQWNAAQKAVQATPPNVQREVELVQANSQLRRVQRDLATERQARISEGEDYTQRIAALEQQLQTAQGGAAKPGIRRGQITWAGAAAALVAAGFLISPHLPLARSATPAVPAAPAPLVQKAAIETITRAPAPAAPAPRSPNFMLSMNRLQTALAAHPGHTPQQVLQEVQRLNAAAGKPPVCSFEWKESGPALLFGNDHKGTDLTSLGATLSRCADAVEQAR